MFPQGLAIGESNQSRAIVDLAGQSLGLPVILAFGKEREPAPERAAVLFSIEPQETGSAVVELVAVIGRFRMCVERLAGRLFAGGRVDDSSHRDDEMQRSSLSPGEKKDSRTHY